MFCSNNPQNDCRISLFSAPLHFSFWGSGHLSVDWLEPSSFVQQMSKALAQPAPCAQITSDAVKQGYWLQWLCLQVAEKYSSCRRMYVFQPSLPHLDTVEQCCPCWRESSSSSASCPPSGPLAVCGNLAARAKTSAVLLSIGWRAHEVFWSGSVVSVTNSV